MSAAGRSDPTMEEHMSKRILILSDTFGGGDAELGGVLMRNFLYSLARSESRPVAVMLANEGVRLVCEGSDVIDDLELMVEDGVTVKACGTCLDFLGLTDTQLVGGVGTMRESVAAMMADEQVVTIR